MNESIGNAMLFNLVIAFILILTSLFLTSMSYTKAYKVKNKIIEELEKQGEVIDDPTKAYDYAKEDINNWLAYGDGSSKLYANGIGYRVNTSAGQYTYATCDKYTDKHTVQTVNDTSTYDYCVYLEKDGNDYYYKVVTFMYFDVPGFSLSESGNTAFKLHVTGETMTFRKITS